jgi:transposase, IS5 family
VPKTRFTILPRWRSFAGVDLGRAAAPDETTILNFRHLLEAHDLCGKILDTVNLYLDSKGTPAELIATRSKLQAPATQSTSRIPRRSRI